MGIFSSLFGKNDSVKKKSTITTEIKEEEPLLRPSLHLKGEPDANGLYPPELVMLSYAERYKTSETVFPAYLINDYAIPNPAKMLNSLQARGYIEVGPSKDSLSGFKVTELKEIASFLGIEVKGKKADIIAKLSEVDEESLGRFVKEHNWKLSERGKTTLDANPYIQYFLERHSYNVNDVGVDIWTVNKEFVKNPNRPYRDIIYRQLNDQMNNAYMEIHKNPASGTYYTHRYCECYRLMGLFIEEEGKSYINAADLYFQFIFKRINIYGGLQLLTSYAAFKNDKKYRNEIIERYYEHISLYPFHKTELLRLIDELEIEGDAVRDAFVTSFKRAKDTGIMTEQEAADFVILELNGDGDKSRDLANRLAQKAVKRIR